MKRFTILMMNREIVRDLPMLSDKRLDYVTDNSHQYVEVAEVWGSDMDDVYRLTQNIDTHWQENFEVDIFTEAEGNVAYKRSSMVGDVIKTSDYRYYMIDSCGFTELENGIE